MRSDPAKHTCQITQGDVKVKEWSSENGAREGVVVAEAQPLKPELQICFRPETNLTKCSNLSEHQDWEDLLEKGMATRSSILA